MIRLAISGLLLFVVSAASQGQTIEVQSGAGTIYGGLDAGIGTTVYLPNSTSFLGAAYESGHLLPSVSIQKELFGFQTVLGSQQIGMTADGVGFALPLVGITIKKNFGKNTQLQLFSGLTGTGEFLPWASGSRLTHVANGFLLAHRINHLKLTTLGVEEPKSVSLIQATEFTLPSFQAAGSAGILNSSRFAEGSMTYNIRRHLTWSVSHSSFFLPVKASGNAMNVSSTFGRYMVQAGVNDSESAGIRTTGENIGGGIRIGWLQENSGWYKSSTNRAFLSHSISQVFRRWSVTESITQISGQNHFSGGVDYHAARWSAGISHSVDFVLQAGRGYETVTSFHLSMRLWGKLRDTQVSASTITNPVNGKPLWSVGEETYVQAGSFELAGRASETSFRGAVIAGRCQDQNGQGVQGCAIQIGPAIAFSNTNGNWCVRIKSGTYKLAIPVEQFTAPGNWRLISAPESVTTGAQIIVVVGRQP